jgi:hypothetical protein
MDSNSYITENNISPLHYNNKHVSMQPISSESGNVEDL